LTSTKARPSTDGRWPRERDLLSLGDAVNGRRVNLYIGRLHLYHQCQPGRCSDQRGAGDHRREHAMISRLSVNKDCSADPAAG